MGRQVFRGVRQWFERLARECPTVLVLEDLPWLDDSSLALLEHLMPLVRAVPLLVCAVAWHPFGTQ
jgi:predicted ATPase